VWCPRLSLLPSSRGWAIGCPSPQKTNWCEWVWNSSIFLISCSFPLDVICPLPCVGPVSSLSAKRQGLMAIAKFHQAVIGRGRLLPTWGRLSSKHLLTQVKEADVAVCVRCQNALAWAYLRSSCATKLLDAITESCPKVMQWQPGVCKIDMCSIWSPEKCTGARLDPGFTQCVTQVPAITWFISHIWRIEDVGGMWECVSHEHEQMVAIEPQVPSRVCGFCIYLLLLNSPFWRCFYTWYYANR
jgi:hypothetical protein